jgi:hypothetical protein
MGLPVSAQLRVAEGTPIVIVEGVVNLWHLPALGKSPIDRRTLCGLTGPLFAYARLLGDRHCCGVCATRAPNGTFLTPPAKKRGGGKPKGKYHRISDLHARALHLLHWEQYVSVNELGRRYWRQFGYPNPNGCARTKGGAS